MIHLYYLITIILTGVTASLVTSNLPAFKHVLKRIKNKFTFRRALTEEQMNKIAANLAIKIVELQNQVDNLAERAANKESNLKRRVRAEVKAYLEELKND